VQAANTSDREASPAIEATIRGRECAEECLRLIVCIFITALLSR
jgi:hypothetical protein